MSNLVDWISRLLEDCSARAPFGIAFELDCARAPLVASVTPADMPAVHVRLDRDDIRGRIDFACRLQALLDIALDHPVPRCPADGMALAPARAGDEVVWACPAGDFGCAIGEYELAAFWPPAEADQWAAPLLAKRFHRAGVTGLSHFSVQSHGGALVARVAVRPDADEAAVRAAASPLAVELIRAPAISTVRERRPAGDREAAHETLTLTGVAMRLARLDGDLHRATAGQDCDFLVGSTMVRLAAAHLIGAPGETLLMDADRRAFADEGDRVSCAGGFAAAGPIREAAPAFLAAQISVYRDGAPLATHPPRFQRKLGAK